MTVLQIVETLIAVLKTAELRVFFNQPYIDCREKLHFPALSLLILEETLLEQKGMNFKQELTVHLEGFIASNQNIYNFITQVKTALFKNTFPFTLHYQGYEITLPEEGSQITSVRIKFKIIYLENMTRRSDDRI